MANQKQMSNCGTAAGTMRKSGVPNSYYTWIFMLHCYPYGGTKNCLLASCSGFLNHVGQPSNRVLKVLLWFMTQILLDIQMSWKHYTVTLFSKED